MNSTTLVLDTSTPRTFVGCMREGRWESHTSATTHALEGLFSSVEQCLSQADVNAGNDILDHLFGKHAHSALEACVAVQSVTSENFDAVFKGIVKDKKSVGWKSVRLAVNVLQTEGMLALPNKMHSTLQDCIEGSTSQPSSSFIRFAKRSETC